MPRGCEARPGVYGAEFSVVLLVEGPRTASIQESLDCLGFYHSSLEGGRHFRLVVELTYVPPDEHPACADPPGDFEKQQMTSKSA